MTPLLFDWILAALLLFVALGSIAARSQLPAVVMYVAYGILAGIVWARLGAVDVALAEAAIGAGLTGVLLLGAALPAGSAKGEPWRERLGLILFASGLSAALMLAVVDITASPGARLGTLALAEIGRAGAENPVTAVLISFRGWDTFLESVVLGIALIAVWALGADSAWGGRPDVAQKVLPAGVLATFGRVLTPLGLIVGVYLVWTGASAPGGAFQGGTVLAAVWLLALMAALTKPPVIGSRWVRWMLVLGPMFFGVAGLVGLVFGTIFAWPPGYEKATVLAIELALTASIAVSLGLLLLGAARRPA